MVFGIKTSTGRERFTGWKNGTSSISTPLVEKFHATCKKELDEMFGNGAQVKVILATFPFGAKSPEDAFAAIRSWLKEGTP